MVALLFLFVFQNQQSFNCYRLNACVLATHVLKANSQWHTALGSGGLRREWGQRAGAPVNGISAPIKETESSPWPLYLVRTQGQNVCLCRLSEDTESSCTLPLDSPPFRSVRNKCFLFKSPNLSYFIITVWTQTKTFIKWVKLLKITTVLKIIS